MILTLMMNLNMFSPPVPPTPDSGGGGGAGGGIGVYDIELGGDEKKRKKRIFHDDNELLSILKMWLKTQKW